MSAPADAVSRAMRLSVVDGVFYALMVGCGESYFLADGVRLGGTSLELGLIVTLPLFTGAAGSALALRLLRGLTRRKGLVVATALAQSLLLGALAAADALGAMSPAALIAAACLYHACGQAAGTAWSSWYGDLVPKEVRGRYFARRNRFVHSAACFGLVGAGLLLQAREPGAGFMLPFDALMGVLRQSGEFTDLHTQLARRLGDILDHTFDLIGKAIVGLAEARHLILALLVHPHGEIALRGCYPLHGQGCLGNGLGHTETDQPYQETDHDRRHQSQDRDQRGEVAEGAGEERAILRNHQHPEGFTGIALHRSRIEIDRLALQSSFIETGLTGLDRFQLFLGEQFVALHGGGETFHLAVAVDVEFEVDAVMLGIVVEKGLAKGHPELHRTHMTPFEGDGHQTAYTKTGDAHFQPLNRLLRAVALDYRVAE